MESAPSRQLCQQGLCQADNRLIFLAFSVSRQVRPDPHRSKLDGEIVPRRNTSKPAATTKINFDFWAFDLWSGKAGCTRRKPEQGEYREELL